ncbi:endospore germination permease [Peribacillus asahii]|uniref:endospore germination permease n=1 Tax=Peribacillus asahii TaxID=228899 RepID=UPI00207A269C|nr:endospore germination permease [Peribacillus asahii]USK58700.1 endospore germination permease [Peribacillus asahii]
MKKIDSTQMFFVLSLSTGLFNHVMIIPILFDTAGRDAWFWALVTCGITCFFVVFLLFILRRKQQEPFHIWLENRIGKRFTTVTIWLIILYLLSIILVTIKDTADWVISSFLFETPLLAIVVPFAIVCFFLAQAGLRAISINSALLLPIVVVLGILVSTGNMPKKSFHFLFPLFEQGYFHGAKAIIYASNGFLELLFLVILQHHFTDAKRFKAKTLVSLTIMLIILMVGPITGALAEFGPILSSELRHPSYEQWRLLKIGKYISHTDFFSIYQWLAGAFIRVVLPMFMIVDLLNLQKPAIKKIILMFLSLLVVIMPLIPWSNITFYTFMKNYYFTNTSYFLNALGLLFFICALLKPRKKVKKNEVV